MVSNSDVKYTNNIITGEQEIESKVINSETITKSSNKIERYLHVHYISNA